METLKNGFGQQFNSFGFDSSLYTGYAPTYPSAWDTTKIPSPLGSKSFPWGLNPSAVNPLPPVVSSPTGGTPMCFSAGTGSSMTSSMVPSMNMHSMTANMANMAANMTNSIGGSAGASVPPPPCPYGSSTSPYLYSNSRDQCSSSIAALRLKAKHHSATGLGVGGYHHGTTGLSNRQPSLSACQYASAVGSGSTTL